MMTLLNELWRSVFQVGRRRVFFHLHPPEPLLEGEWEHLWIDLGGEG
jgi:hypothetical protein